MRCHEFERLISDGLAGSLAPGAEEALRAHLRDCPACRDFELRSRLLQERSRAHGAAELPEDYWKDSLARLRRRLEAESARTARRFLPRWGWRWVFAGAPLVLAAAVGLTVLLGPRGDGTALAELAADERLGLITAELGDSPLLESAFNDLLESSINDQLGEGVGPGESSADNPLLGQDISDEELAFIIEELKKELSS